MPATGPKVSSLLIAIASVMPVITVGSKNCGAERVALAAEQHLGAVLARVGDVALDLLDARQVDQRPDVDVLGEAVGHDEPRRRPR